VVQNNVNWLQASAPVLVTTYAPRSWISKENPADTANGLGSTNRNEQLEEHYTQRRKHRLDKKREEKLHGKK
jgi:hypothetical protein